MTSKPWYAARWETVEPEEPVYTEKEECYDEPSLNELIDMEFGYEPCE
ncbi:hypothetical protein PP422_gp078 [Enterobacter phage vB_EhoM-IME523]|uniref:Uncharacterized protein n=2 Tax=Kanagawavirus TaxID=2843399 RepID=A0AAE7WIB6_9CAUD|nr:hypothetical protein PP421_gp088 [Kosakonia phage 305]YP_010650329.1 hypothetical protein PP422_gp078 [Enterobacter phage vB_EhoM-IME523]QEA10557.1 hypothetical protein [Enterobacter phage vB_EhoM-IME523]QYN80239.1 hypothetical protein [Kosakonia phage 305]